MKAWLIERKLNTNLFSFVLFCFIPFTRVTLHFLANGIKQSKQKEKGTSQALCLMVHEGSVCGWSWCSWFPLSLGVNLLSREGNSQDGRMKGVFLVLSYFN